MSVTLAVAALASVVLSLLVTCRVLAFATRHGMLDLPGRRRSHRHPTPRGGGAGIVAALLLVAVPAWGLLERASGWGEAAVVWIALLLVALAGWRDDRAPLPVWPRLATHLAAAALVAAVSFATWIAPPAYLWWTFAPVVVALAGCVNIHNFMDGIDGILALQGLFVLLGCGVLAVSAGQPALAALAIAGAGGCLGFLAFNVPPARIFMGDVGSGTLGLAIGIVALLLVRADVLLVWPCLTLSSAFLVDGGLTLGHRVVTRQRWYAPHRQHLYQWLVRVNWSHARTDLAYMIWNLVVVAPLAWAAVRWPAHALWYCIAAYGLAAVAWHAGRYACLARARRSTVREAT